MSRKKHPATQAVHAGMTKGADGEPFMQGPVFASTFHLSGEVNDHVHQYARFHHPNWEALEKAIGEFEQGKVVIFPSGMAASAALMSSILQAGDTVLLASDGYPSTRSFAEEFLQKFGVSIRFAPTKDIPKQDFSEVRLVFLETPSNPMLDIVDIEQLANEVHKYGALLAIDNTTMTPLGQKPLLLGADISMCSDTKAMNGHSDVVFGHVAVSGQKLFESLVQWRKLSGSIAGPMETWLVHRGLSSLDMRLERMVKNASVIAAYLKSHAEVSAVRYPGLSTDPSHTIASKQMLNYGFVISFDLQTKARAECWLQKNQLIYEATSFGGMHTMAERRARWGGHEVSPGLIRLSVGCEHVQDIVDDIGQALNQL